MRSNGEEYAWYRCTVNGGRESKQIGAYELAKAVEELGVGEVMMKALMVPRIEEVRSCSDSVTSGHGSRLV
ncbi:hypothetical protein Fmac_026952 [Flemingia macrophylla]|uniref:Uncharacterized protein n=1 Tax=Flemingia macrophylla TaxID=520843 RepID=A0ABD1LGB1_9FABA